MPFIPELIDDLRAGAHITLNFGADAEFTALQILDLANLALRQAQDADAMGYAAPLPGALGSAIETMRAQITMEPEIRAQKDLADQEGRLPRLAELIRGNFTMAELLDTAGPNTGHWWYQRLLDIMAALLERTYPALSLDRHAHEHDDFFLALELFWDEYLIRADAWGQIRSAQRNQASGDDLPINAAHWNRAIALIADTLGITPLTPLG